MSLLTDKLTESNHLLWLWHLLQWNSQDNLKIEAETCGWYLLPLYSWTDSDKWHPPEVSPYMETFHGVQIKQELGHLSPGMHWGV